MSGTQPGPTQSGPQGTTQIPTGYGRTIGDLTLLGSADLDPATDRVVVWDSSADGAARTKASTVEELLAAANEVELAPAFAAISTLSNQVSGLSSSVSTALDALAQPDPTESPSFDPAGLFLTTLST